MAGSNCCGAPMRVESSGEGTSYGVCTKCGRPADGTADEPNGGWEIMYDVEASALTIYRTNGVAADSEGPTLYNREEFERFISNVRYAAAMIWPDG